ncbi:MAG: hypothetical protein Q4A01_09125 [Coriobacteriales bacterium]|nr:hypothetical protein [Coriobacteriales bacterium]
MLAIGFIEFLAGLIAGVLAILSIYASGPEMRSSLIGMNVDGQAVTAAQAEHFGTLIMNFGIYSLFVSISLLVMSVFSWLSFRREDKAKITSRVAVFCIALCLAGLLWGIFGGVVGWTDFLLYVALLLLEVGSLYLSLRIHAEASPDVHARMEARKNRTREERLADNEHLGFLRFIEFVYVVGIVSTVVSLVFMSRNSIVYDFGTVLSFIDVVLDGVCLF